MAIQYQSDLDRTFHALGDGSRRAMIAMLAESGECSAGELGAPFGYAQPTISKHIKVLEQAGLVTRRIEGRHHRFLLSTAPLDDAENWINRHKQFWSGTLDRLSEFLSPEDE